MLPARPEWYELSSNCRGYSLTIKRVRWPKSEASNKMSTCVNVNSKLVISTLHRNYRAALTYVLLLLIAYSTDFKSRDNTVTYSYQTIQASIYAPSGRQGIVSAGPISTRRATILAPPFILRNDSLYPFYSLSQRHLLPFDPGQSIICHNRPLQGVITLSNTAKRNYSKAT